LLARPRLRETRPDAPSVRGVVSVAVPDANVTINRDIGAAQVVTKDSQTGFTVYADVAAAKELVNVVKGVTSMLILPGTFNFPVICQPACSNSTTA